jgi:SAM-dependent methyltransferase
VSAFTASMREGVRAAGERRVRNLPPARRLRLELAAAALERFAGRAPLRVLDAGCETGLLTNSLARRHADWRVHGVDLNERSLEIARLRAAEEGTANVSFERVDLTRNSASAEYDAVAAMECLTEIPDDLAALRFMAGALRPGGLLLVHVPERDWQPVLSSSPRSWKTEQRHGYSRDELEHLLRDAGLDVLEIVPTTRSTIHLAQELREHVKDRSLKVRLAAYPVMTAALKLEQAGITWGAPRALFAKARKS